MSFVTCHLYLQVLGHEKVSMSCHVLCRIYRHMLKSIVDMLLCQCQGLLVASGRHSISLLSFVLMSILVMRITSLVLGLALNSFCHFIRQSAVYSIPLNMCGGQAQWSSQLHLLE